MNVYTTINPTTGNPIQTYKTVDQKTLHNTLNHMDKIQKQWNLSDVSTRVQLFAKWAKVLHDNAPTLAHSITTEMGKPIKQAMEETTRCVNTAKFLVTQAESWLRPKLLVKNTKHQVYIKNVPMGIVFAVKPWNFPVSTPFFSIAYAILAGNAVLFKPAESTIGTGKLLQSTFEEAGFPLGLFTTVVMDHKDTEFVLSHPAVRELTFTGSSATGSILGAMAGKHVVKSVMELGGSDAYIVMKDADPVKAGKFLAQARMRNCGQICISPKRLIVHTSLLAQFTQALLSQVNKMYMGDPFSHKTDIGPMARADLRTKLHQQVQHSIKLGAYCLLGGTLPAEEGFFYPATILDRVKPGMPAFDEEIFGPVVTIIESRSDEESIQLANASQYGLGGGIITRHPERVVGIAENMLDTGSVAVNNTVGTSGVFEATLGGVKYSGYGTENGYFGFLEYIHPKTLIVDSDVPYV